MDLLTIFALIAGTFIGALTVYLIHRFKVGSYQSLSQEIIQNAEQEADSVRRKSEFQMKQNELNQQREFEQNRQIEMRKIQREEDRVKTREDKLESRMNLVEKKLADIENREEVLKRRREQIENEKEELSHSSVELVKKLEQVSGLTRSEAKENLSDLVSHEVKKESANLIRKIQKEAEEGAEREASRIISTAINRLAVPCVSEVTVNTVNLPSDDMKGRIIGREGRNIRALEQATGINFMIDDTPGAVVLSGFDPIRLHTAKAALTELLADGRIHPTRIEEAVENARLNVDKQIRKHGEDAALRADQMNLHPEIIQLLGKLKFRYSYGQNVLEHSLEVSHILGIMAAELGLDQRLAKRVGLLHDMGKAVAHEMEGTHAVIGHDLALKYGENQEVANGIGCHHGEMKPLTIEASLCSAADALSASRPGARIEAVEEYVKRLRKLEDIAYEYPGVDRAYAMQAGREIRIAVLPDMIDDDGALNLARDLSKRIESELNYPGKIKVTVIRERRVVEYAV